MPKDIESSLWLELATLRAEGKNVESLIKVVEENMFEEADKRIDAHFVEKRKILYEAKKGGEHGR